MFRQIFNQSSIVNVSPEQAGLKQKAGAIIVDVREPSEWQEGHINNAIPIPLGSLSKRLAELDRSREIITVCRSGQRSMAAAQQLQQAGFSQVSNLAGGMNAWIRQRLPVRKP